MKKWRVVICDDTEEERERCEKACRLVAKKHDIKIETKVYDSGNSLLFDLENPDFYATVDIIYLDINMPGSSGIEVARAAREYGYKGIIVFFTVSKQDYENAFDVRAFNYITKGNISMSRFEKVFLEAIKASEELHEEVILFSSGGEFRQIPVKSILYFEVASRIVTVYYGHEGSEKFEFISTLEKIENQLFVHGFRRTHRAFLVSLSAVHSATYERVVLNNGTEIPVGRKYYPELKKALAEQGE